MANLLITGGAGFIGANFIRHWRDEHPDDPIIVVDALTYAGNTASLPSTTNVGFVREDIRNTGAIEKLMERYGIDTIIHFAAETHVDRSIVAPDVFLETNVLGTYSLLKAAKSLWLDRGSGSPHRFHNVSTDEVFGSLDPQGAPFSECAPYAPNSIYSASKAGADHLVRAYHVTYGLDATTTNCSNNYGPYQFPEKLVALFMLNALHGKPLPVYGDGRNVRDWIHVQDHCKAIELAVSKGRPGDVFTIGGGFEATTIDMAELICAQVDRALASSSAHRERFPEAPAASGRATRELISFVRDRPGHDRRYAVDDRKARARLGFAPAISLERGIADTLDWYLTNAWWWEPILAPRGGK